MTDPALLSAAQALSRLICYKYILRTSASINTELNSSNSAPSQAFHNGCCLSLTLNSAPSRARVPAPPLNTGRQLKVTGSATRATVHYRAIQITLLHQKCNRPIQQIPLCSQISVHCFDMFYSSNGITSFSKRDDTRRRNENGPLGTSTHCTALHTSVICSADRQMQ